MEIPKRLYGYGQVAVDPDSVAHRVGLVAVSNEDRPLWIGRLHSTNSGSLLRYGVGCITDDRDQPPVLCYGAQWAAEIVGITEACTTCWPDEEGE